MSDAPLIWEILFIWRLLTPEGGLLTTNVCGYMKEVKKIEWNATHFTRLWRVMGATYFHKNVTIGALILWQCEPTNNFSDGEILESGSTVVSISLGHRQYTPCSAWVCDVNVIRRVPKTLGHELTKWNPITTGSTTAEELRERSFPSFVGCYVACSNPLHLDCFNKPGEPVEEGTALHAELLSTGTAYLLQ